MNASLVIFDAEYGLSVNAKSAASSAYSSKRCTSPYTSRVDEKTSGSSRPRAYSRTLNVMIAFSSARCGCAHELVHLGVRGQVHDEVDRRVLDAADAAAECGVVAGEVLEQRREARRVQAFWRLSTPKTSWPSPSRRSAEVRADLAGRAGDQDAHRVNPDGRCDGRRQAATRACCGAAERRRGRRLDLDVDESPGGAVPGEVHGRVPARAAAEHRGSVRDGPSTSTCSTRPTRSSLRSRASRCVSSTSRSMRSIFTSCGT